MFTLYVVLGLNESSLECSRDCCIDSIQEALAALVTAMIRGGMGDNYDANTSLSALTGPDGLPRAAHQKLRGMAFSGPVITEAGFRGRVDRQSQARWEAQGVAM